ncbi:MAG TPA: 4-(cytidine 5'-diphospho)-2-C-methyl-D-erythritol kinase [Chitinophagaceae bacterium]
MIVFPNAKINLGLHILHRRPDGFHAIETVFYPTPLKDALEVIHATEPGISLELSGLPVDGPVEQNLCIKAWQLLKKDFPELPPVKAFLLKAIPMGGGLGGGSADGAFMLRLLDSRFRLNLTTDQKVSYAAQLGSDCPFFILNQPCLATGRGELLEPMDLDLSGYRLLLANPGIHISTAWAFAQLDPAIFTLPRPSLKELVRQPVASWKDRLTNDFETPVLEKYPAIKEIREMLYREGAVYASLSGSGSTVYGLFEKNKSLSPSLTHHYPVMNL